jgi:cytidine deaminase
MKKHTLQADFFAHESPDTLPDSDRELLAYARRALENSYSPYSNFKVGAAVLFANGEMLGGANYENASYPMCICAEQSVLAAAATRFPNEKITAIAVTVRNPGKQITQPAAPCGACRQVIFETEQKNRQEMRIILQGETGPVYVFEKGSDLLPLAFGGDYLG